MTSNERVITLADAATSGSAGLEVRADDTHGVDCFRFRVIAREGVGVYRACETLVYPAQVEYLIAELRKLLDAKEHAK